MLSQDKCLLLGWSRQQLLCMERMWTQLLSPGDTSNWTYDLGQTTNSSFEMLRAAEWVRQSQLVLIRQNRVLRRASKGRLRWSEQFESRWWLERREAGRAKPAEEKHGQAEVSCIQETLGVEARRDRGVDCVLGCPFCTLYSGAHNRDGKFGNSGCSGAQSEAQGQVWRCLKPESGR